MLNPSDSNLNRAEAAEIAQMLRGYCAFGSIAFHENALLEDASVQVEQGYGDCLPILGGGYWRDPASLEAAEAVK